MNLITPQKNFNKAEINFFYWIKVTVTSLQLNSSTKFFFNCDENRWKNGILWVSSTVFLWPTVTPNRSQVSPIPQFGFKNCFQLFSNSCISHFLILFPFYFHVILSFFLQTVDITSFSISTCLRDFLNFSVQKIRKISKKKEWMMSAGKRCRVARTCCGNGITVTFYTRLLQVIRW